MMLIPIILILAGFILLMIGAEYTVRGSVAIANKLNIPTLIIGLTIVAFGTSAPEFVVSISAALKGSAGIAIGNIIGSNIANILLVLGVSAVIFPLTCVRKVFVRDYLFLFFVTGLFILFAFGGSFVRWQGLVMLGLLLIFLIYNYHNAQKNESADEAISPMKDSAWWKVIAVTAVGLAGIIYGADVLVKGAVDLARVLGVSEEIIGLTIIAFGTSLPELATSGMAAFRRQNGVALGNIIGSNIWNIVFILGATASIINVPVPVQFLHYDIWVMAAATVLLFIVMYPKGRLSRPAGGLFVVAYLFYLYSQVMIGRGIWNFGA